MSPEEQIGLHAELKEDLKYEISIVVHRHGPKEGIAGPLSTEGEAATADYFTDAYENVAFDDRAGGVDIEYSPIGRTEKTAEIYDNVVRRDGIGKIKSSRADERLSEGNIAEHLDLIEQYGGRGGKWLKGWMEAKERPLPDVKTGQEAATDFADWLLSKITDKQKEGGVQEIDAFSHGPVMAAFILELEKKLGEKVLPEIKNQSVFENVLNYLSYMNFHADSSRPDIISFSFGGKKFEIPIAMLEDLASH